jgi:hypothetical protein
MPEVPETDFEKTWRELEEDTQQEEDAEMYNELEKDAEAAWRELEEEAAGGDADMEDELEKDAEAAWRELEEENQMDEDAVDMEDELAKDAVAAWRELEEEAEQELQEETSRRAQAQTLFEEGLEGAVDEFLDEAAGRICKAGPVDDSEREGCTTTAEPLSLYECTLCGPTATPTLRLKTRPDGIGFTMIAGGKASISTHYCLDCSEKMAREFANGIMMSKSIPLRKDRVRTRVITHLMSKVLSRDEMALVADHFGFCRCCCNPTALVEAPGDPCNHCSHLQRCHACGRFRRLLIQHGNIKICRFCRRHTGKRGQRIVRADFKTGKPMPQSKCYRCGAPTVVAMRRFCSPCRHSLQQLPGEKCITCKLEPKPEKSNSCAFCRAVCNGRKQTIPGVVS